MDIKDQLPSLGKEQEDGTIKIGEHITLAKDDLFGIRPDYKVFREKNLQSEFECAAVLVGIRGIEHCKQIVDEFGNKIAEEEGINYAELIEHPKGHVWCQFDEIMQEIRKMIDLGVASAELKVIKIEGCGHFKDFFFKSNIYYDPLQFIALAQKNSFPIHDEVQIGKDKNGILFWIEGKPEQDKNDNQVAKNNPKEAPIDISISKDKDLKWNIITITPLNEDELLFQFNRNGITRHYDKLGFEDNRKTSTTNDSINAWKILLKASTMGGFIHFNTHNRKSIEKHAQILRAKFYNLFPGIKEDPIPIDKKNSCYKFSFYLKPLK